MIFVGAGVGGVGSIGAVAASDSDFGAASGALSGTVSEAADVDTAASGALMNWDQPGNSNRSGEEIPWPCSWWTGCTSPRK